MVLFVTLRYYFGRCAVGQTVNQLMVIQVAALYV